jgi:hypothetical protein
MEILLENNADVNLGSDLGITPLISALVSSHVDCTIISLLLAKGADINVATPWHPTISSLHEFRDIASETLVTPIYLAILRNQGQVVQLLLSSGATLGIRELTLTIRRRDYLCACRNICNVLDHLSSDVSLKGYTIDGVSALQFLFRDDFVLRCSEDFSSLVKGFMKYGYDINSISFSILLGGKWSIYTAFRHLAMENWKESVPMFEFLLPLFQQGGPKSLSLVNSFLSSGHSGYHDFCCYQMKPHCCKYFIKKLLSIFADNSERVVSHPFVFHKDHGDMLKALYKAGAVFPPFFRLNAQVCTRGHPDVAAQCVVDEFEHFCDWLEGQEQKKGESSSRVRKLQVLTKATLRKLPSIREGLAGLNVPEPIKQSILLDREVTAIVLRNIAHDSYDDTGAVDSEPTASRAGHEHS